MGVNNRKRRASRERKRQRAAESGPGSPRTDDVGRGEDEAWALVASDVLTALRCLRERTAAEGDLRQWAAWLTRQAAGQPPGVLAGVLRDLLAGVADGVHRGGWWPSDLRELVSRNLGPAHVPVLVAALHEEQRVFRRGEEWQEVLDRLGPARPLRLDSTQTIASALGVAALLAGAPLLTDVVSGDPETAKEHPKLVQARALLAKAESTEFEREAEALSAKAQELITRYALGRLLHQSPAAEERSAPRARRIWLDAPYVRAKTALVHAVASANRCRSASADQFGFSVVVGSANDLDAVELLVTSLLVQADVAMLRHGSRIDRSGVARTRSFRHSFLSAYAARIGERLAAASEAVVRAEGGLLPVLHDHEAAVSAAFDRLVPHTVRAATSVSNGEGWVAGMAAADLAQLDVSSRPGEAAG